MKNKLRILFFSLMCCLQIGAAIFLMQRHQTVVNKGATYKFKCIFYDPVHPFQGRYLQLNYPTVELTSTSKIESDEIYAIVEIQNDGFANFTSVQTTAPTTQNYIQLNTSSIGWNDTSKKSIHFQAPFARYYLDESLAPEAETLVAEALRDSAIVWSEVQIYMGKFVLKDVKINGQSVKKLASVAEKANSK